MSDPIARGNRLSAKRAAALAAALAAAKAEAAQYRHANALAAQAYVQLDAQLMQAQAKIAALEAELVLLRELAEDVARWRESGDGRDLAYVLETADKTKARGA